MKIFSTVKVTQDENTFLVEDLERDAGAVVIREEDGKVFTLSYLGSRTEAVSASQSS